MQFECPKETLQEAITYVSKAVSKHSAIPILTGILITADVERQTVCLTSNNQEISIEYKFLATIEAGGSLVIDAALFGDIVRRLPEGSIELKQKDKNSIHLSNAQDCFKISILPSDDFPRTKRIEAQRVLSMHAGVFKNFIKMTSFAASTDETRRNLTGCFFKATSEGYEMVAIDGFRMALCRQAKQEGDELRSDDEHFSVLIASKTLRELYSLLDEQGFLTIELSEHMIRFEMGNIVLTSRIIEEEYLNHEKLINNSHNTQVTIATAEFRGLIDRANLLITSTDRRNPVTLDIKEDELSVMSNSARGSFEGKTAIDFKGEALNIIFNPRFFMEALKVIDDEKVNLYFQNDMGPCLMKPTDGEDFLYMILPMRK